MLEIPLQPVNGHQRRRSQTRQLLLDAGRELFVERGVKQTSIGAITNAAGVAKGSFYNHFDSREALFEEVLAATLEQGERLDADAAAAQVTPLCFSVLGLPEVPAVDGDRAAR